jgi:hypothetical protein
MTVAPITIRFMLACYYAAYPRDEIGVISWESPAGIEVRDWLKEKELVDDRYQATERGRAWVEMITETPLPDKGWIDPRTGERHVVRPSGLVVQWSDQQDPDTWEAGR